MSYIAKPSITHPSSKKNKIGLKRRDYEGVASTLCAGCGHDSITAAIITAFFELDIEPHRVVKTSGIGCSSKTPAYFLSGAHGFNSVHGRMPSVTTGANAANRGLHYIGVSGDGDSLSIGLGQFCHAARRNLNMLYIIENNGVYGLTKGQFSASADIGTKAKKGDSNILAPIDAAATAISLGANFVARSFSGDKPQLVPLIKAGLLQDGFALIDVISPCVTFNNHVGSTKSYGYTREHLYETVIPDFIPVNKEINVSYKDGESTKVAMHDGTEVVLRKIDKDWDPTDLTKSLTHIRSHQQKGEIVTGLLYLNQKGNEMHRTFGTVDQPLVDVPYEKLNPGQKAIDNVFKRFS